MPSRREWPHEHTEFLLDYIDVSGDTLATPGPRRIKGYEKLRKLLNAKGIPRPKPAYSTEEINAHCSFLKEQHSAYQGPNLKAFFKNGRAYLSPPLGTAVLAVHDTSSETLSVVATATRASATPFHGTPSQRLPPRLQYTYKSTVISRKRSFSQDVRRKKPSPLPSEISAGSLGNESNDVPPQNLIRLSPNSWQDLFYLRSEKRRVSIQAISPAMVRLKRNAERAVDSYLESGDISLLTQPDIEHIRQCHQELSELLGSLGYEKHIPATTAGKISNVTLLRSLIAWAAYKWIFQDPFPVFGTESGGIWDDLKEMLQERGGDEIMDEIENLRLDLQFRLSEKRELIEKRLPARADELARKLAGTLEPLFSTADNGGQQLLLSTNHEPFVISDAWIPALRKTFLHALEITIQLRQREVVTRFTWPEPGVVFDDFRLQAENNGTKLDFEGKCVLLTLVPAASSWIPNDDEQGEMEEIIYSKALAVLDMDDNL